MQFEQERSAPRCGKGSGVEHFRNVMAFAELMQQGETGVMRVDQRDFAAIASAMLAYPALNNHPAAQQILH